MGWFFRIVAVTPLAYTISAFVLGYFLISEKVGLTPPLQFGVLLTLIISSTATIISLTTIIVHYWTAWKIANKNQTEKEIHGTG